MQCAQVIGAGIVGTSVALALQRCGFEVELFERNIEGRPASFGNAGHLATEQIVPLASLSTIAFLARRLFVFRGPVSLPPGEIAHWLPFGIRMMSAAGAVSVARGTEALRDMLEQAIAAWERLLEDHQAEHLLRTDGHFVVWTKEKAAKRGRRAWLEADIGHAAASLLTRSDREKLGSLFGDRFCDGVRFEGTGSILSPAAVLATLRRGFVARGGRLTVAAPRLSQCLENPDSLTVIAAGYGSKSLMEEIGIATPMIAERGYHIEGDCLNWPECMPTIVMEDMSIVVAPMGGRVRLTGFVEFGGPCAKPDPRKWAHLEDAARTLGLPLSNISRWTGARPTLPDYLPAIGRVSQHPNLLTAFGHQHLGLTLGPLTGELVAQIATRQHPSVDCSPFAPERFMR